MVDVEYIQEVPKHKECGEYLSSYERLVWKTNHKAIDLGIVYSCNKCNVYVLDNVDYKTMDEINEFIKTNKTSLEKFLASSIQE